MLRKRYVLFKFYIIVSVITSIMIQFFSIPMLSFVLKKNLNY